MLYYGNIHKQSTFSTSMATVRLENITKRFGDLIALDAIDLDIRDEEFFVLLGQTGAGKTTTLRCIAGLDTPEEGTIYLDDVSVTGKTPAERDVAFVFQSHILYPHLTVYENMAFPLHPRKLSTAEIDRRVRDIAGMLHIEHLLLRTPNQLSGGETQRVGLGRAMVRRPQVFLMDEPISNLDAKLRTEMRAEIRWRQRELGTTTFYVTHDQIEAMSMADRIAVLEAGKIQQLGTPADIYNHPANLFVAGFIGNPSMNCLPCAITNEQDTLRLRVVDRDSGIYSVAIQDAQVAKTVKAADSDRALVFGVHPEDVIVSHEPIPNAFQAEVYSTEPLGAETVVELRLGEQTILKACTAPNFEAVLGASLYVTFVPERMHFFDEQSGAALAARDA